LLAATCPRELIAFGEPPACLPWPADEHERHRWCRLLSAHGIAADPDDLELAPPACARSVAGATVVHVGASSPSRRWPLDRWAAVVAALMARGHHVVLTGSEHERPAAERVAASAGLEAARVQAGRTGLGTLAGLVAGAAMVLSGDTGVAHLAFGYRRPSVTVYGPTSPAVWGPPELGPHVVLWSGRVGDPHGAAPDPGLLEITATDVLDAVARLETASLPR
jgi:ADP-heptose:LPS heptosyltransferase